MQLVSSLKFTPLDLISIIRLADNHFSVNVETIDTCPCDQVSCKRETYSDCTHLRIPLPLLTGTKDANPQILSHQVMIDRVGFPGRIQEVAI